MRITSLLAGLVLVGLAPAVVCGDVLHRVDGTKIEGDVKKSLQGWIVTDGAGKVTAVPAGEVKSIELKSVPGKMSADAAETRLYSLRRSVENVSQLGDIVDRYKRFVEQNKNTETGKAAEKELAVWTDRLARGMVKVGQEWVTPEERDALLAQTFTIVSDARQLIKDEQHKEADALLVKALAVDPGNPSIQYLRGVLKYRQDEIPAARKAFEAVTERITNHAPSLNNLAVILARQNHPAASLGMYDRAMQGSPNDRQILDNVAEAFYALSPDERKAAIVQKAIKRFLEQDQELRAAMEANGLFRWGATWVNKKQLDELMVAEGKIKGRLDELATEFDSAQMRINTIDQDLAYNANSMRALENSRYRTGADGRAYKGELSPRYYQLQEDNGRLQGERKQQVQKMQQLRAAAKEVEKQLPTPRYTGTQKLIETEGTPVEVPAAEPATTEPSTQPAEPSSQRPG